VILKATNQEYLAVADNWLQFSEVIPNLTAEQEEWLNHQLEGIAIVDGKEYPNELGEEKIKVGRKKIAANKAEFAGCRAYRDMKDYDFCMQGSTVGFQYEFDDDRDSNTNWGRHMWLYAEEGAELDLVAHLVQKFLRKFRPKECWSLTYATTCSKPRVGEFGGGAVFVTAAEIKYENAYGFIDQQRTEFAAR
jgi:hypothetical protein